jgi:hypothetical protein
LLVWLGVAGDPKGTEKMQRQRQQGMRGRVFKVTNHLLCFIPAVHVWWDKLEFFTLGGHDNLFKGCRWPCYL